MNSPLSRIIGAFQDPVFKKSKPTFDISIYILIKMSDFLLRSMAEFRNVWKNLI